MTRRNCISRDLETSFMGTDYYVTYDVDQEGVDYEEAEILFEGSDPCGESDLVPADPHSPFYPALLLHVRKAIENNEQNMAERAAEHALSTGAGPSYEERQQAARRLK